MLSFRLAAVLVIVWLLLSGHYTVQLLILGALSVALVVHLAKRLGVLDRDDQPFYFGFLPLVRYWLWLGKQILLSNLDVTRRVLDPALPIRPTIREIREVPETEVGRVIYANSITLTPGTTSVNFTPDDAVVVHALHAESLDELDAGAMADQVRHLEPHFRLPDGPAR